MAGKSYRVRAFGAASVLVDGRPLHLTSNMRRMLCLIVAAGPDGLSIDRALHEAADGDGSAKAQSRIRMDVSRLRKRVGAELLPNAAGVWRLAVEPASVDFFSLQQQLGGSNLPDGAEIVAMLQGRPFHDAQTTPLIEAAVAAANAARLDLLRRLLDEPHRIDAATLAASRTLLDDDPLNEDLIGVVVDHHLVADQASTARDILYSAAVNFHEMLGIALPERLISYEREVGDIRPPLPGTGAPSPGGNEVAAPLRMVGREHEEDVVVSWLEDDEGPPLVISGPSGSGKTTLSNVLADEALAQGISVVRMVGREFDNRPYSPLSGAVGSGVRELINTGAAASEIWSATLDDLTSISTNRSVLIVDDAQWVDSLTRDVLLFLLRANHDRLRLVLSGRPSVAGLWESIIHAAAEGQATTVELSGLPLDEIEQLIVELRPSTRIPVRRKLAAEVHEMSGGLPAVAVRLIERANGSTLAIGTTSSGHELAWLVAALEPEAQRVGTAAAVLGHRTSYPEVRQLVEMSDAALLATLEVLAQEGVLIADTSPGYVSFAHALVREAFLDHASAEQVHQLRHLAASLTEDVHRRAQLLAGTGPQMDSTTVAEALRTSAEQYIHSGALAEAVRAFEQADALEATVVPTHLSEWAGAVDRLGLDGADLRKRAFELALADGSLDAALEAAVSGLPEAERPAGDPQRISLLEEIDASLLEGRARFVHAATLSRQYALAGQSGPALALNAAAAALIANHQDEDDVSRAKWLASCAIRSPSSRLDDPDFYPTFAGPMPASVRLLHANDYFGSGRADEAYRERAAVEAMVSPAKNPMLFWHCKLMESTMRAADGKRSDARSLSDEAFDFGLRYGIREASTAWIAQIFVENWMFEPNGAANFLALVEDIQPAEVDDSFLPKAALAVALDQLGERAAAVDLAADLVLQALPHQSFAGTATIAMASRVLRADHELSATMFAALEPLAGSIIVVGGGFVSVGPADAALGLLSTGPVRAAHFEAARRIVSVPEYVGWQAVVERDAADS